MKKDIISIVENAKVTHPIVKAAMAGNRYWVDFLSVVKDYEHILTEQEYSGFLSKSRLDCEINMAQYLQFATESTVVDYIIRKYNGFRNEPRYNSKKNPECSFEFGNRTVNIEVKCPDIQKRMEQEKLEGIKLFASERFPDKDSYTQIENMIKEKVGSTQEVHSIDRLDNKLKDFLAYAHKKFPPSGPSYFNVLVIALDIIQDMDEWYSYILGDNGAFTNKTYIEEDYSNVDAVLITNVQHGHMADTVDLSINCWHLENYVSLLLLNPQKEQVNGLGEYYFQRALDLFGGLTRDFLSFQFDLDQKINARSNAIDNLGLNRHQTKKLFDILYMGDKLVDLKIISEWVKTLKKPTVQLN